MRTWGAPLLLTLAVACSSSTAAAPAPSSPAPTTTAPAVPTITPTAVVRTPAVPARNAAGDFVRFLAAATAADTALDRVATKPTAGAVAAIDLGRLAAAIPAGLDPELLRATLLVYGDLVSRHSGLRVASTRPFSDAPDTVRRGLANAAAAAKRYPADLAALVRLVRARPPVTAVPPASRAGAEVAVRAEWIRKLNAGCASEGGAIPTALHTIRWQGSRTTGTEFTGTVERIVPFTATWTAAKGWKAVVESC